MTMFIVYFASALALTCAFIPNSVVNGPRVPRVMGLSSRMTMATPQDFILASSITLSEQKITIDAYESSGVPPVFLFSSLGLVLISTLIPVLSRKQQVKKNSRSIDETILMDAALEEKITNVEILNESYDKKGSVGRYTKD